MLIGHQKQWNFLKKTFEGNRLSHAYLFCGLELLGKKTLAQEFIKLLNCQEEKAEKKPCGNCNYCKMIEKRSYPDFLLIEPDKPPHQNIGSGGKESDSIQIFQIRELQHFLSFRSYYGQWKAAIIDNAEKMTKDSQSCLLKTLEEPKEKTILILVSSYPDLLLATIYSRCQTVKFFPVKREDIKKYLLKQGTDEKKAELLAESSQGRPGRAISFFREPDLLEKEGQLLKKFLSVFRSDIASRFEFVKNLTSSDPSPSAKGEGLDKFLLLLEGDLRSILLFKTKATRPSDFYLLASSLKEFDSYPISKLEKSIKLLENIIFQRTFTNINPRLALELLMLEIE